MVNFTWSLEVKSLSSVIWLVKASGRPVKNNNYLVRTNCTLTYLMYINYVDTYDYYIFVLYLQYLRTCLRYELSVLIYLQV